MIEGFRHKGLRQLYENDNRRLLTTDMVERVRVILAALDSAETLEDLNRPSFRLHPLKGDRKGVFSVSVSGNWRITFRHQAGDAMDVNLEDYH